MLSGTRFLLQASRDEYKNIISTLSPKKETPAKPDDLEEDQERRKSTLEK
jgi:hypothetical protein